MNKFMTKLYELQVAFIYNISDKYEIFEKE